MKNLQDGSLVRLVQVTDVTGSNETQAQGQKLAQYDLERLKSEMDERIATLESEWEAGFVKLKDKVEALEDGSIAERVELDDFESLSSQVDSLESDLNEYPSAGDVLTRDEGEAFTEREINALIDKRLEGQVTSVTSSLVRVLLAECPTVADELGKQYMLEREHIIESNKTVEHRINFPSNQRMAEEACDR